MRYGISEKYLVIGVTFIIFCTSVSSNNIVNADHKDTFEIADGKTSDFISYDEFDKYGGWKKLRLTEGSGFFNVTQDENGTWWLVTPEGHAYYQIAYVIFQSELEEEPYNSTIQEKYGGDLNAWGNATWARLKEWGFNQMGSKYCPVDLPHWKGVPLKTVPGNYTLHEEIPDVFDPVWQENVRRAIENATNECKEDTYLIAYGIGYEELWGPVLQLSYYRTLIEWYMTADHNRPGKQHLVEFFRNQYDDNIQEFNHVWRMNLNSFDELLYKKMLGRLGVIAQRINKRVKEDIQEFRRLVAKTCFEHTAEVIREYDPNHLVGGPKFHYFGIPQEVIEEAGNYCDLITFDYFRKRIIMWDPIKYFFCLLSGAVPMDRWLERYYEFSNKTPLIINGGPFCMQLLNCGCWELSKSLELTTSKRIVLTQLGRAIFYKGWVRKCFEAPYIVGFATWPYVGDHNSGYCCGLVDLDDNPYTFYVHQVAQINSKIFEEHRHAK